MSRAARRPVHRPAAAWRATTPGAAAALAVATLAVAALLPACRGSAGNGPDLHGVPDLVRAGETLQMARALPAAAGAGDVVVLVARTADGHDELRVGEKTPRGWIVRHASRPGDEFRNLTVEDVNADGRPEVVSRWSGGQIEIIEVLARGPNGDWGPLLQNGAEVIEERRRPDRTVAFWLTSRTYEEDPGHPPVYETTVYAWDGKTYAELPK